MIKKISFLFFVGLSTIVQAQVDNFSYKRPINGIDAQWHSITIPNEVFGKAASILSDIRIYGITKNNDTIEAPYILKSCDDKKINKKYAFKILNMSTSSEGVYYTFDNDKKETINNIDLEPSLDTYDWKLVLEGSENQREWYTLLNDYRIFSVYVDNKKQKFHYSTLCFPESNYRYFRLLVKTVEKMPLNKMSMSLTDTIKGEYSSYTIISEKVTNNKKEKNTQLDISLSEPVPVSRLLLEVNDKFDFEREFEIQYLSDSIKTEHGWKPIYTTIYDGTVNSRNSLLYDLKTVVAKQIRVLIYNQSNQPLDVRVKAIKGVKYKLIARFIDKADYYLYYGNQDIYKPDYDIEGFTNQIPDSIKEINLGKEIVITKKKTVESQFVISDVWLWIVMGVIIVLLVIFSVKMIKSQKK